MIRGVDANGAVSPAPASCACIDTPVAHQPLTKSPTYLECIYWETILDSPKGRVIGIDITNPAREYWTEVIPEREETLRSVGILNNQKC